VETRVSLVTLGVANLAAARGFYAALGWHGQEVQETVFVQAGALALVLWNRSKLAEDSGVKDTGGDGFGGVVLAQNVRSRAEVDAIMADAQAAGANVSRPAAETFYGGYAGVFADLDGTCGRSPITRASRWLPMERSCSPTSAPDRRHRLRRAGCDQVRTGAVALLRGSIRILACTSGLPSASNAVDTPSRPTCPVSSGAALSLPSARA